MCAYKALTEWRGYAEVWFHVGFYYLYIFETAVATVLCSLATRHKEPT